jgi:hypothetical protein
MMDFLAYIQAQFPNVWEAKVFGYPIAGEEVLQCGASCDNFRGAFLNYTEQSSNQRFKAIPAMDDLRDVIRYRNNLERRGTYFQQNYPGSKYGSTLLDEVKIIDADIANSYNQIYDTFFYQIVDLGNLALDAGDAIYDPLQLPEVPSTDPRVVDQELVYIKEYLDDMEKFAKAYAEFNEFYDAGVDMTRIAGRQPDQALDNFMRTEITPTFQIYNTRREEIRRVLERTPVAPEQARYKENLLIKTM